MTDEQIKAVIDRHTESSTGPTMDEIIGAVREIIAASVPNTSVEPVAWYRQTDIRELTDSEPETDGWTPLYAAPLANPSDKASD